MASQDVSLGFEGYRDSGVVCRDIAVPQVGSRVFIRSVIAGELLVIYNFCGNERNRDEQYGRNAKPGSHIFDQSVAFPGTCRHCCDPS